ncbi:uncharacterized protein [Drosophila tropicalis]|uniref:uncharacterized protein n=1 Tax=Drosophila tropicalis TaxID=46794 RepID=UPI0035AB756F
MSETQKHSEIQLPRFERKKPYNVRFSNATKDKETIPRRSTENLQTSPSMIFSIHRNRIPSDENSNPQNRSRGSSQDDSDTDYVINIQESHMNNMDTLDQEFMDHFHPPRPLSDVSGAQTTGQRKQEARTFLLRNPNTPVNEIGVNTKISTLPLRVDQGKIYFDYETETDEDETDTDEDATDAKYKTAKLRQQEEGKIIKSNDATLDADPLEVEKRISKRFYHQDGKHRNIGTHTIKPSHEPEDDGQPIGRENPINEDYDRKSSVKMEYELLNGERNYYEGCEYHFPVRKSWRHMFYNGRNGKYFSRYPIHWLYTFIYCVCHILFVILLSLIIFDHFAGGINMNRPYTKIPQPFLSFAPVGSQGNNYKHIEFDPRNKSEVRNMYLKSLNFLRKYGSERFQRFGLCNESDGFGYSTKEPCIFLKINRLIGFTTNTYNHSDQVTRSKFNENDHKALKGLLSSIKNPEDRQNRIWITCQTIQNDHINIEYFPEPAVHTKYTDIENRILYHIKDKKSFFSSEDLNRIVAIKIYNLTTNEQIHINCKLWARNIHHTREDYGQVSFYILLANRRNRERRSSSI